MSKYVERVLLEKIEGLERQVRADIATIEHGRLPGFVPMLKSSIQDSRTQIAELKEALIKLRK